jgi:hypothetical protein
VEVDGRSIANRRGSTITQQLTTAFHGLAKKYSEPLN